MFYFSVSTYNLIFIFESMHEIQFIIILTHFLCYLNLNSSLYNSIYFLSIQYSWYFNPFEPFNITVFITFFKK